MLLMDFDAICKSYITYLAYDCVNTCCHLAIDDQELANHFVKAYSFYSERNGFKLLI